MVYKVQCDGLVAVDSPVAVHSLCARNAALVDVVPPSVQGHTGLHGIILSHIRSSTWPDRRICIYAHIYIYILVASAAAVDELEEVAVHIEVRVGLGEHIPTRPSAAHTHNNISFVLGLG